LEWPGRPADVRVLVIKASTFDGLVIIEDEEWRLLAGVYRIGGRSVAITGG
jgi:hypothetical protein